jgi:hypothetical protein
LSKSELVVEDSCPRCHLVRLLVEDGCSLFQNFQCCDFGRLVLLQWVLKGDSVQGTRRYKSPVIFTYLDVKTLPRELTTSRAVRKSGEDKFIGVGLCKHANVEPTNGMRKRL